MNKDFKRLTFADTFWGFVYGLVAPFLTIYFNNLGDISDVGISVALFYLILGFVSLLSAKMKSTDYKRIFLIAQIAEGIRIVGFIFANNIYWVYIIQLIGGVTAAFIRPAYSKIFVVAGDDEDDYAFRNRIGIMNIVMGISALIAGFLINIMGYQLMFLIWGIGEVLYGIYVYLKL